MNLAKRLSTDAKPLAFTIGIDEPGHGKSSWHIKFGHYHKGSFSEDVSIDIPDISSYLYRIYQAIKSFMENL